MRAVYGLGTSLVRAAFRKVNSSCRPCGNTAHAGALPFPSSVQSRRDTSSAWAGLSLHPILLDPVHLRSQRESAEKRH